MRPLYKTPPEYATARKHVERRSSNRRCGPIYWESTMSVRIFDQQDECNPLNGTVIADKEQLCRILESLRQRKPFFAELYDDNGYNLLIGIGEEIGCVQYSRADGNLAYLV